MNSFRRNQLQIHFPFSVVSCPGIPQPANGQEITYSSGSKSHGSVAAFICNTGFYLNGTSTLTCGDGSRSSAIGAWSGTEPTCIQSKT